VKLACEWAKTMTEKSSWIAAAKVRLAKTKANHQPFTGLYTANKAADDEIMNTLWKPSGTVFDQAVRTVMKVQDDGFALPASPGGAAITQAWTDAVNKVLAGQATPAAALKQAQREAQAAIDAAS
jgi:multiple sugar transport system substrate-binding protein